MKAVAVVVRIVSSLRGLRPVPAARKIEKILVTGSPQCKRFQGPPNYGGNFPHKMRAKNRQSDGAERGSDGGMVRAKKFNDSQHERNRKKVAAWREKKPTQNG